MVNFTNGFHKNNQHRASKTYVNSIRHSAGIKITQEYSCCLVALNLNRQISILWIFVYFLCVAKLIFINKLNNYNEAEIDVFANELNSRLDDNYGRSAYGIVSEQNFS